MDKKFVNKLQDDCLKRKIPIISDNTNKFINKIINRYKPTNCLEIGSAVWYSMINIADTINKWDWKITWFEISYPAYKELLYNTTHVKAYNTKAYNMDFKYAPLNKIIKNKLDFVFIDAMKREYLTYYKLLIPFLNNNSILIFDDVIKFQYRLNDLYRFFEKNQIIFQTLQLDADDWVILIEHK